MLSITSFVVFTAVTLAMQKTRQSSEVVWTSSTEGSGWPTGVQVLIALASPTIAFCPIDGSVHLIEEVKNPRRVVPRAVIAAYVIASGTALLFVLSMLYSVSDYSSVLSTPSGFPPFEIWRQASNTGVVPIVFTAVCICLLPIGTTATLQVTSMMTWSLAGDGALAFKRHLSRVHPGLNAPVWALFLNLFLLFLIGCLYLFSNLGESFYKLCMIHFISSANALQPTTLSWESLQSCNKLRSVYPPPSFYGTVARLMYCLGERACACQDGSAGLPTLEPLLSLSLARP